MALGIAGIALATLPLWLGLALTPILKSNGITFERYDREGYVHFRLEGVRYIAPGIEFTAGKVRSPTPLVWSVQRLRGAEPALSIDGWQLQRTANPGKNPAEPAVKGLPDLEVIAKQIGPQIAYWLPRAHLSAGELRGFGPDMAIDQADWSDTTLKVEGLHIADHVLAFELAPDDGGAFILTARSDEGGARVRLVWSGAVIKGEASLWDQVVQLTARFPATGWLPDEASAIAENWRLPAARVNLGTPYATVSGDARLTWSNQALEIAVSASAEPDAGTKAPAFEARAVAKGNLRELTLTELHVDTPFAAASLTAPITFAFDQPLSAADARLVVKADLAKLPWLEASGQVEGNVTVSGNNAATRQEFELRFGDVAVRDFTLKGAQVAGVLEWPRMELTRLSVQLDEASSLEARGTVDWRTRELKDVGLEARLGNEWFSRWLPAEAGWATAEVAATAEGPLDAPRHSGTLKIDGARLPPLHPFDVDASWQGADATLEVSALATAKTSTIELAGTLDAVGLKLTGLDFSPAGRTVWKLTAPALVTWSPVWRIGALQLAGPDSRLTLTEGGGTDGAFELTTTRIDSAWMKDWVTIAGPEWRVHTLTAAGWIADGALAFDTTLAAQIEMAPRTATVSVIARGDARGIELEEFKVVDAGRVLTQATGRLPISWKMEPKPHLSFDETEPIELSATTVPDSLVWATVAAGTGLQLTEPSARIDLKGTLRQLVGEAQIGIARLAAKAGRFTFPIPDLDALELSLQFDRKGVTLTNFSAQFDGQAVQASGAIPMDDANWQQLLDDPATFDWSQARAKIEIPDADLAPIARRFPNFVAGQGRLAARIELAPGGKFSGELQLTHASTRPLAPFGSLQEINADLVLADRLISLRKVTATLGGEPVTLDGSVTLVPGAAPRLALGLKGDNLPLVRSTGMLLRSDLDLHAITDAAGVTRLSGALTVRNCLVLANLNLAKLLPTGRRGVTRQPPYFAVDAEPFRDWPLAFDVRAPGTVRVRTTVYNGTASAQFKLGGTLGEPRAVGALTVDDGRILFPFATFKVQQGAVRLRESDPFHAVVNLTATSQRHDYQLQLDMTGELPEPNLTITSSPSLPAADALLLVMTGQPPVGDTAETASGTQRLALLGAYLGRGFLQDLGLGGDDRLEISAGENVSRQGRETYGFEYSLGNRWSLLGEYDEYDAYNAGVKWRIYTQEGAPVEEK